jgi:hypothetical protein
MQPKDNIKMNVKKIGYLDAGCCLCAKLANPSSDRCGQLYDKENFGMVYRT